MMDYSKAQMVSVDGCLVTLPLVFVTVTKQMTIHVGIFREHFHFNDEVFVPVIPVISSIQFKWFFVIIDVGLMFAFICTVK